MVLRAHGCLEGGHGGEPPAAVRAGGAALTTMPSERRPRYLVVVRLDRPDVYEHLHAIATPGVDLLWDRRRRADRRAAAALPVMERRTITARRRKLPDTWTVLGFCIGRRQEPPA